ncbi:hypothetical protein [Corallococcus sicarius]|uniref:SRPBCC family protein n=1 Tax=Corallococcus sicarius TaxID=2316726 RepID=A0A3A8NF90_9BACT|nr:hypothetical protein [Corallococcus sicarius]RKH39855.1 hypothetical protein D7X12_22505 [Corallococcus sicarius]
MSTGRLAGGGFQAGVRRSFAVGSEMAWSAWGEGMGLARWVGAYRQPLGEGEQASLPDGTRVTVVRRVPPRQLRLRLERDEWPKARTVQLRVLPSVHGVIVALHAEGLRDEAEREQFLAQWTHALEGWEAFSGREVTVSPAKSPKGSSVEDKDTPASEPPALEPGLARQVRSDQKKTGTAKKAVPAAKRASPLKKGAVTKRAPSQKKGPAKKKAPPRSRK